MPLLRKQGLPELPSNELSRIKGRNYLKRRQVKDAPFEGAYAKIMRRNSEVRYTGWLKSSWVVGEGLWCLPHQQLYGPKKSKNIWVIFDCAAK